MQHTWAIVVGIAAAGCSPKATVGLDEKTRQELANLRTEVSKFQPIAEQFNQNIGNSSTKVADAVVEAAKLHGSALDPFGIKQLLKENEELRKELEKTKSVVEGAQLEPGVREDVPDFRLAPSGGVCAFAGPKEKLPDNWRLCDGAALATSEFQELFKVLGTRYGDTGDVSFNLPNYQGYFLRGLDPKGTVDPEGQSRTLGKTPQGDSFRKHMHVLKGQGGHELALGTSVPGATKGRGFKLATGVPEEGAAVQTIDWDLSGGEETRPANIAINWIIRVK